MMINLVEKLMPEAAKLGTKAVIEIVGASSIGAGVVSFGLDKGTEALKNVLTQHLEAKKAELEARKAEILEAKKATVTITEEEVEPEKEVKVDEKPKTSKGKKNK
jgi:hypothetical protein